MVIGFVYKFYLEPIPYNCFCRTTNKRLQTIIFLRFCDTGVGSFLCPTTDRYRDDLESTTSTLVAFMCVALFLKSKKLVCFGRNRFIRPKISTSREKKWLRTRSKTTIFQNIWYSIRGSCVVEEVELNLMVLLEIVNEYIVSDGISSVSDSGVPTSEETTLVLST